MTRSKTLTLLMLAGALAGCSRPTQQESTYRLNLQNKFSWQGPGPDIRVYWPWYSMYVVSHQQEIQTFPLTQGAGNANMPQIELEKLQSIITADGQIMIQEMSITIYKKADAAAVEPCDRLVHRFDGRGGQCLMGVFAGFSSAAIALVASQVPEGRLGYALGWLSTGQLVGSLVGPLIGGPLADLTGSYRIPFYCTSAAILLSIGLVWAGVRERFVAPPKARGPRSMISSLIAVAGTPALLALFFVLMMAQFGVRTVQPISRSSPHMFRSWSARPDLAILSGIAFSITGLANVIAAPFLDNRSDRVGCC